MSSEDAVSPPVAHIPVEGDRDGVLARLEYFTIRTLVGAASRLPHAVQGAFVGAAARLARRVDRRHSDAARRFLTQAFGDEIDPARREQLVLCAWRHLFGTVMTAERIFREPDRVRFDHDPEALRPVLERGRGAVVCSPHLGNWEAAGMALPRLGLEPVYFVSRPPRNRPLSRHFQRSREAVGMFLVPRHGALRHAMRILRACGFVVMMIDQRARIAPVTAPFFGRPAQTEQGPAMLMQRLGVPIVVGGGLATEDPWRFRLRVERVLWPEDHEGRSHAEVMADVNAAMEGMIRAAPEQYFWLHDRWRGAPEAE